MSYNIHLKDILDTPELRATKKMDIVSQREIFEKSSVESIDSIEKNYNTLETDIMLENDIILRHYKSKNSNDKALLHIHGGGWCLGSIDTYDNVCRYLCDESGFNIFSIEYGLSPEHKFPTALNQCLFAYDWLLDNASKFGINKNDISVMGDSAGGTFATVLSHERQNNMPKSQILVYPAVDMYTDYDSKRLFNKHKYHLTLDWCNKFADAYLGSEKKFDSEILKNPKISPIFYENTKQPKTLIVAVTHDILTDGIYAYEEKLRMNGTNVETYYDDEMFHGFISTIDISPLPNAKNALDKVVEFLNK